MLRVFPQVVGEVLNSLLDDPVRLANHLESLGRQHERLGVPRHQMDALRPSFVRAVRPVLQTRAMWNAASKDAWRRLLKMICHHMKRGYQDQSSTPPPPPGRTHSPFGTTTTSPKRRLQSPEIAASDQAASTTKREEEEEEEKERENGGD